MHSPSFVVTISLMLSTFSPPNDFAHSILCSALYLINNPSVLPFVSIIISSFFTVFSAGIVTVLVKLAIATNPPSDVCIILLSV